MGSAGLGLSEASSAVDHFCLHLHFETTTFITITHSEGVYITSQDEGLEITF